LSRYGAKSVGGREVTLFRGTAIQGEKKTAEPVYLPSLMIFSRFLSIRQGKNKCRNNSVWSEKTHTELSDPGESDFSGGQSRKSFSIAGHRVYNCGSSGKRVPEVRSCRRESFWGDDLSKSLSKSLSKWHGKRRMDNWTVTFFSSLKISLTFRDAEFDPDPDFDLDDLPQQFYGGKCNRPTRDQ
jgi:hypothetical protein